MEYIQYLKEFLFIYSGGVIIINLLFIISLFAKSTLTLPTYKFFNIKHGLIFYLSIFYQLYFWATFFNII